MSLPRRHEVQPREILARLDPSLGAAPIRELGEGWDNVAWLVGNEHVLRVSKYADLATRKETADKDIRILDLVGPRIPLATSRVVAADPDEGALLLTHVAGAGAWQCPPTDVARVVEQLGELLVALWAIPIADAAHVVERDREQDQWLAETADSWEGAAHLFTSADQRLVESFLAQEIPPPASQLVFSHNDLGEEHLIVDPATGALSGVIDWSDSCLGDPARDLALILFDLDPRIFDALCTQVPEVDEALRARVRWYAARAGVEGVAYRARMRPDTLAPVLASLRRVLTP